MCTVLYTEVSVIGSVRLWRFHCIAICYVQVAIMALVELMSSDNDPPARTSNLEFSVIENRNWFFYTFLL